MDRADAEEEGLSARRLFSASLPEVGAQVELGEEAAQHARVLRLAPGDVLELFDGAGGRAQARVERLEKRRLHCVIAAAAEQVARGPRVVLVQCVPKGRKLDDIVRMTTELGVAEIRLAISERCIARDAGSRAEHKVERLARIALEAVRQSEQPYMPDISAPLPLRDVLSAAPVDALKLALLERTADPLPGTLTASEAWVLVGPEGGFSAADRGEIGAAGFQSVSFGRAILRTETAAVVGVALVAERLRHAR